jgi:hypothetical protein
MMMENDRLTSISGKLCISALNPVTPLERSTKNVEKKRAEPRTPHFLSLNQDIVAMTLYREEVRGKRCLPG